MTASRVGRLVLATVGALSVLSALAVATAGPASASSGNDLRVDTVDTSGYPDIALTVTWPSRPADDGAAATAVVEENGQGRQPTLTPLQRQGLAVAILMDTSGSMTGAPLDAAKAAAGAMVSHLPQDTKVGVIGFSTTALLATPPTTDRTAVSNALAGLSAGGGTAMYDAVTLALDQLPAGMASRREIVLLSDGGDNSSTSTIDAAVSRISAAGVGLDVVELVTTDTDHATLDRLARTGGGSVISAADPAGLANAYDSLARGLTSEYRIEFKATGHGPTPLHVALAQGSHSVAADLNLNLPLVAPTAPSPTAGIVVPTVSQVPQNIWPLVIGAGLCFLAALIFLSSLRRPLKSMQLRADLPAAHVAGSSVVSRLAEQATVATDRVLERHGRRSRLNDALERAGILLRPGEFVVLASSGAVVALGLGTLLANPLVGVGLAAGVVISVRVVLGVLTSRRRRQFTAQLGDNLQLIASTLRSGYGVLQAMDVVAQEADAPSREEFRRIVVETRLGRDVNESLRNAADRVGGEDFAWVAQAIEINREVGGDLASVLDNVASTIRERDRIRRQVRALSAEGRVSAYVLVALPLGLAGVLAVINPGYISELTHGVGLVLSAVGFVMLGIGSFWLSRMVNVDY